MILREKLQALLDGKALCDSRTLEENYIKLSKDGCFLEDSYGATISLMRLDRMDCVYVEPRKYERWLLVKTADGRTDGMFTSELKARQQCLTWQSVVKVTYELPPE